VPMRPEPLTEEQYEPIRAALFDGPPGQSAAAARQAIADALEAADLVLLSTRDRPACIVSDHERYTPVQFVVTILGSDSVDAVQECCAACVTGLVLGWVGLTVAEDPEMEEFGDGFSIEPWKPGA
jgi:hypothetical protein